MLKDKYRLGERTPPVREVELSISPILHMFIDLMPCSPCAGPRVAVVGIWTQRPCRSGDTSWMADIPCVRGQALRNENQNTSRV